MAEKQYVSFYIDKRLYGFEIHVVKEVVPNTDIVYVPRSEKHIRGLVNIRGQVVLVMDIAVIFGRAARAITEDSQIVILKTSHEIAGIRDYECPYSIDRFCDKPVGFLVDQIGDVLVFDEKEVESAPPHLAEGNARFIEGVGRIGGQVLVALNAMEMLQSEKA